NWLGVWAQNTTDHPKFQGFSRFRQRPGYWVPRYQASATRLITGRFGAPSKVMMRYRRTSGLPGTILTAAGAVMLGLISPIPGTTCHSVEGFVVRPATA